MTGESLIAFFFFWGIWLLVPMLVDGTGVLTQLVEVWTSEWKNRRKGMTRGDLKTFPRVVLSSPFTTADAAWAKPSNPCVTRPIHCGRWR